MLCFAAAHKNITDFFQGLRCNHQGTKEQSCTKGFCKFFVPRVWVVQKIYKELFFFKFGLQHFAHFGDGFFFQVGAALQLFYRQIQHAAGRIATHTL